MACTPIARLVAAAIITSSSFVAAEPLALDLRTALDRAHRFAPDAVAARGAIAEAEAGRVGAALAFTANPEVEIGAGPRFSTPRQLDLDASIAQSLEPGRRGARRHLAGASVDHARADGEARLRELDLAVAFAFYDALAAEQSVALAARAAELAERGSVVADRRRKAGDITDLDANLARVALGRARSALQAEQVERAKSLSVIAGLVGAGPADDIVLRGELGGAADPERDAGAAGDPGPTTTDALASRADVRALDAERVVASAERANAAAAARPDVTIWASYQREDATNIVLAGLRLTLPIWNSGDGEQAVARAKERRATEMRAAVLATASRQVVDAATTYAAARRALGTFESEVAPVLDDSEKLLQRSVDAGQIAIADFLVVRQELAAGRRDQLERRLAVAKAAVALRYAAGGVP